MSFSGFREFQFWNFVSMGVDFQDIGSRALEFMILGMSV